VTEEPSPGIKCLKGGPSVLYDAVALLFGEGAGEALMGKPEARDFVADAFAHCKIIGFSPEALPLLDKQVSPAQLMRE